MNVHGVYDTSATMLTYYSREEYQQSLQQQAGVSGSIFGFYAGVKKAWGSSFLSGSQKYMAVYSIDIDRWLNIIFNLSPCVHCLKLVQSFSQIYFMGFGVFVPVPFSLHKGERAPMNML